MRRDVRLFFWSSFFLVLGIGGLNVSTVFHSAMITGVKDEYEPDEIPAGRNGSAQDIAGIILFLVEKGGAYINGSVQISDGGRLGIFPAVY